MYAFCDFEATGLPSHGTPEDDPKQPRIVQAAVLRTDARGNVTSGYHGYVAGVEVPSFFKDIDTLYVAEHGLPGTLVAVSTWQLLTRGIPLAFNLQYAKKAAKLLAAQHPISGFVLDWDKTWERSVDIQTACGKVLGKNRPRFEECCRELLNRPVTQPLNARADVALVRQLFFVVAKQGAIDVRELTGQQATDPTAPAHE